MAFIKKICGLTRTEDAQAAADAGATHLGFIFAPSSPRNIGLEQADSVISGLAANAKKVAVTAGIELPVIQTIAASGLFDVIQLHIPVAGAETIPLEKWDVVRVADAGSLHSIPKNYPEGGICLLDTYAKDKLGGTGSRFDWGLLNEHFPDDREFILAGGLDAEVLASETDTILSLKRIAGLDVSSGVESAPGIKDHKKIQRVLSLMDGIESGLRR